MTPKRDDRELSRLLRAGDPAAADQGLDGPERAEIRRRMIDASAASRRTSGWLVPAVAALAVLAVALGLVLNRPPAPGDRAAGTPPQAAAAGSEAGHQVQFTTDRGTLVVWLLQPRSAGQL